MKQLPLILVIIIIIIALAYNCYKITQMPPLIRNRLELIDENKEYCTYRDINSGHVYRLRKITKM